MGTTAKDMEKLNKIYESIAKNKERWSYYSNCDLEILGVWNDSDDALNFIRNYFTLGNKQEAVKLNSNYYSIRAKMRHTISSFLIGTRLAEILIEYPEHIFNRTDNTSANNDGFNFKYYWFLACLYHDVGYLYENGQYICQNSIDNRDSHEIQDDLSAIRTDGLNAIKKICNIRYLHNRVFKTYSKNDVKLYLEGRATCANNGKGCIDHGIAGGLVLYDRLRRQFEISWKNRNPHKSIDRRNFYINFHDLHLSNSHYEAYAQVANAIIAHNIWINTLNYYKQQKNVSSAKRDKINFEQDPLCFILCLADTLEPLKRCIHLECVKLGALPNERGISIVLEMDDCCSGYNQYVNGIKKLGDWLDVDVNFTSNTKSSAMEERCFKAEIVLKERGNSNRN